MKKRIITLTILVVITSLGIIIILNNKNKSYKIDSNNDQFAFYYQDEEGNYIKDKNAKWKDGYILNIQNSLCDGKNNPSFLFWNNDTNSVILTSNKSTKCTLYFYKTGDKVKNNLINLGTKGLSKNVIGDMYRYVGTNDEVSNYICFGTDNPDTDCKNNLNSEYLYRIIGIDRETGKLKLIKANELKDGSTNRFKFNSTNSDTLIWETSDLYNKLNGTVYLNNDTLIPEKWREKIAVTTWKYGILSNFNNKDVAYDAENNFLTSYTKEIAIMYVSDYLFSYSENTVLYNQAETPNVMYNSWVNTHSTAFELTMDFYTALVENNRWHWMIMGTGPLGINPSTSNYIIRPVFYLIENIEIIRGDGSIQNPFIIKV